MSRLQFDDLLIAYELAQSGSLTATGAKLQMTHTTVARRISGLEESLEATLFIRHQRGYQLTDTGKILLRDMPDIEQKLNLLLAKLSSADERASGTLRVTVLAEHVGLLGSSLKYLRQHYPDIRVQLFSTDEIVRVESGNAHVSLRAGPQPNDVDVIAHKLMDLEMGYYASKSYVEDYGLPNSISDLNQHYWAMPSPNFKFVPFVAAIWDHLMDKRVVYQSNHFVDLHHFVLQGLAIAPMAKFEAEQHSDLIRVPIEVDTRSENLWFVYHKNLKHSKRIQAFYEAVRASL